MISHQDVRKFVLLAITVCGSSAVPGQKPQDCRTKEDVPPVTGHWKDDQTGKEVDITALPSSNKIVARYSEVHNCPHPDVNGKPMPLPIDFDGTYTTRKFAGLLHVCSFTADEKHPQSYTTGTNEIDLILSMTADGLKLTGKWKNPSTNKIEDISLTRLSKPEYPFRKFEIILAAADARIYEQPDSKSKVRYTPPPGTRLMIYSVELDEAGIPTWYQVSDAVASLGSKNYGWIPAGQVRCQKKVNNSKSVG